MKVEMNCDSIASNVRISTLLLEYPRFIHAELLTHRVFSKNSASSRAIPTPAVIAEIRRNPAKIVWWGKQMSGMQAKEQLSGLQLIMAKALWKGGMELAIFGARLFSLIGLHKQLANRILEPFQNIRVVLTSTEWNNFFALRKHPDAQPELQALAEEMYNVLQKSTPQELKPGMWHLPYIKTLIANGVQTFYHPETEGRLSLQGALQLSTSLAAQESYRKSDASHTKTRTLWQRLIGSTPVHASPTEHQAMPCVSHCSKV